MDTISQGELDFYMARTAEQLTPPNLWWSVREFLVSIPSYMVYLVVGIVILFGPGFLPAGLARAPFFLSIAVIPVTALFVASSIMQKEPGYWRRYSVFQCFLRFPEHSHQMLGIVEALRHTKHGASAEFEVAVLERKFKYYGAVLFLVMPPMRGVAPGSEEFQRGTVAQIFNSMGEVVAYDELTCHNRVKNTS